MSEADDLVERAQRQLDEHKRWLASEIDKLPDGPDTLFSKPALVALALLIKLRVARASATAVSVVWEYPDELYAFLKSPLAPSHLRDTLVGGHVLNPGDPNQPTFSVSREVES